MRSSPCGVLAAGRSRDGDPPHAATLWRAGGGREASNAGAHALLPARGAGGHPRYRARAIRWVAGARGGRVVHGDRGAVMLVVMEHGATPDQVAGVVRLIEELGYQARPMP